MEFLQLFDWYNINKRQLPFRKTLDPYKIWVSEIMLQQTQVDTMLPYYDKFLTKYPTIKDLNSASMDEVISAVQGIGYYRRFRMLKEGAKYIVEKLNSKFPDSYEEIIKVPGIGTYSAGAILSIAFNKSYPATDGNVIRVLSRYYGLEEDFRLEKNRKKLNLINQDLINKSNNPHDYTQSMMELGATVCRKAKPKCNICPLFDNCIARKEEKTEKLPFISPLKTKKELKYFVFVLSNESGYILRKRNEELLNGFYEYVQIESDSLIGAVNQLEQMGFNPIIHGKNNEFKHIFTHLVWNIESYFGSSTLVPSGFEVHKKMDNITLSTVSKKIHLF